MALALEGRAMKDDIMLGDTPKARNRRRRIKVQASSGRLWKHSTLADIDGLVSADEIAGMFTFTMVRNPWDRMVSYYHWLQEQSFDHAAVHLAKATDFSGFLAAPTTRATLRAGQYRNYMIAADGLEYAQLYVRLEAFEADAEALWDRLGFRVELPHVNASPREADYRVYYSDSDAALVSQLCRQDIERFEYSF